MPDSIKKIIKQIENIENEDSTIEQLEDAMNYFCSTWDKCEGFKHAIIKTLEDQYTNHAGEQDCEDVAELKEILKL